jgi:hypothetical protein
LEDPLSAPIRKKENYLAAIGYAPPVRLTRNPSVVTSKNIAAFMCGSVAIAADLRIMFAMERFTFATVVMIETVSESQISDAGPLARLHWKQSHA